MKSLKDKVAVVTGAASGIGRALAERFAREGMRLVMADIDEGALDEAHDAVTRGGAPAIAVPTDVARWEDVERLAGRTYETFGAAHVVCNNAGVGMGNAAWLIPPADWEWILGVNLRGVAHGIRAFVPRMLTQEEGHVVNTASIAGLCSAPGMAPYCATKHAVVAISECLHHDLALLAGGKIKVSVVCPGWVKTRIADGARHRPAWAPADDEPSPQSQIFESLMRSAVASGISPASVADRIVEAILGERFWVFTHPKTKRIVEARLRDMLEDRTPTLDFAAALDSD